MQIQARSWFESRSSRGFSSFPMTDASSRHSFIFIVSFVDMTRLSHSYLITFQSFPGLFSSSSGVIPCRIDWRARFSLSHRADYLFSQLSSLIGDCQSLASNDEEKRHQISSSNAQLVQQEANPWNSFIFSSFAFRHVRDFSFFW